MKDLFSEKELERINESHHGGLRFDLKKEDIKIKTVYRATVSGGLDYFNNYIDKIDAHEQDVFTVYIYDRNSTISARNWRQVAYLQRTKNTHFNH